MAFFVSHSYWPWNREICEVKPQNKNDHTLYMDDYKIIIQVTVSRTSQEHDMIWEFFLKERPEWIQINFLTQESTSIASCHLVFFHCAQFIYSKVTERRGLSIWVCLNLGHFSLQSVLSKFLTVDTSFCLPAPIHQHPKACLKDQRHLNTVFQS